MLSIEKREAPQSPSLTERLAHERIRLLDADLRLARWIGYRILGPLCYGFGQWLAEKARDSEIDNLFFLSRDGWFLKQTFDSLPEPITRGLDTHYLYSSRRAVWFASLREDTPEAEFHEIVAGAAPYVSVGAYLSRVFIRPTDCAAEIRAAGFQSHKDIVDSPEGRQKLYRLFQKIRPRLLESAAIERQDYLGYLQCAGVFDRPRVGLVDVGWTGSVLKYTRALSRDVADHTELTGFFVGVGNKASTKYRFTKNTCLHGYLFDFDDKTHAEIRRSFFVLEKFLSPGEPSLMKMVRSRDGFIPVFNSAPREISPFSSLVQQTALAFIEERARVAPLERLDPSVFLPELKRLLARPDGETARLLSRYSYSTDFGYHVNPRPIASSRAASVYLRQPLELLKDYRRARWKPGFIAQQPAAARLALRLMRKIKLDKAVESGWRLVKRRR